MKNKNGARIIIISGPSGVGKGTLIARVRQQLSAEGIETDFSVSATTRPCSSQETDGVHYHFISLEQFEEMLRNDRIAEYNKYGTKYYGTPRSNIDNPIEAGRSVFLDIDVNGKKQIIEKYFGCVTVFILPPSIETLEARIRSRARDTDTEESIAYRLQRAIEELDHADEYMYRIVNDDLETAAAELCRIIKSEIKKEFRGAIMEKRTIDDVFAEAESRYALVDAIAKKAREIAENAELNSIPLDDKPVNIVIQMLIANKAHIVNISETEIDIIFDERSALLGNC